MFRMSCIEDDLRFGTADYRPDRDEERSRIP